MAGEFGYVSPTGVWTANPVPGDYAGMTNAKAQAKMTASVNAPMNDNPAPISTGSAWDWLLNTDAAMFKVVAPYVGNAFPSMGGQVAGPVLGKGAEAVQTATQAGANASGISGWIDSHAGNWGLILAGAALGLGALLISQKSTIVQMVK